MAQQTVNEGSHEHFLSQKHITTVQADSERDALRQGRRDHAVGYDPMGMQKVEVLPAEELAQRAPGGEEVEGSDQPGGRLHFLVGGETAAVTEQLERLRGITEAKSSNAILLPLLRHPLGVRRKHRDLVSTRTSALARSRMNGPAVSPAKRG